MGEGWAQGEASRISPSLLYLLPPTCSPPPLFTTSFHHLVSLPQLERAAAELGHRSLANTLARRHHYYHSKQVGPDRSHTALPVLPRPRPVSPRPAMPCPSPTHLPAYLRTRRLESYTPLNPFLPRT